MNAEKTSRKVACPSCDSKAKRVSERTMGALLKDEFASRFQHDEHSCCSSGEGCSSINGDTGWRFCESTGCDVVYFSENDDLVFEKSQLKVAVGVKQESGERPLCYCFEHSIASIKQDLLSTGHTEVLEDIRAKMKSPGCRCETANPSGSCCLGSVAKGIQIAHEELQTEPNLTPVAPETPLAGRGEKVAKIGTVLSAIMASACCWLPLLLLAVGVSGAGIAATLEAYRPVFIVVTFGFLGAAFYFTYRPRKMASGSPKRDCCGLESMKASDCCETSCHQTTRIMAPNKIMLWGVTVVAVAFLLFPSYVGALFGTSNQNAVTGDMNRTVIKIEGMTCEGCATTAAKAIRKAPGVLAVEVNYEKRQAIVGTEASKPVPTVEMLAALKDAGYAGEVEEAVQSESTH